MGKEIRNFGDWMDAKKQSDANSSKPFDKEAAFSATETGQSASKRLTEQSGPVAVAQRALDEHEAQYGKEDSPERQKLDALLSNTEQGRAAVANRKEHYRKLKAAIELAKGQASHDAVTSSDDAAIAEQKRTDLIRAQMFRY